MKKEITNNQTWYPNFLSGYLGIILLISGCSNSDTFTLGEITQLTFSGDNGEAYFSTDGSHLVFQSKRNGNECDKIYTMTSTGENIVPLVQTDGAFTCAYYSLDDQTIFFSSTLADGPDCPDVYKHPNPHKYIWPLRNFEIFSYNTNEGLKQLTHVPGYNAESTVHPTEEKIIFTSMRNGDIDLYEINYDGSELTRITHDFGYDGGAFYSPNGEQIVWRGWYPSTPKETEQWSENLSKKYIDAVPLDIYVANRDGSNKVRLTNNDATNWAPSWHPDGNHIVFSSNMDDWNTEYNTFGHNFEIYIINIRTKKIRTFDYQYYI